MSCKSFFLLHREGETFVMTNLELDHSGVYECFVKNEIGEGDAGSLDLVVNREYNL